jgi:hypothetical protein
MRKERWLNVLILLAISTMPSAASVCFTLPVNWLYDFSKYEADFNNDGIEDRYKIFDEYSTISLSRDGDAFVDEYNIHETWAINYGILRWFYGVGIGTEVQGIDANLDGFMDVVAAFGSRIVIRINDGNGGFSESSQYLDITDLYGTDELPVSESKARYNSKIASMGLNKDGYDDLVVVHKEGIAFFINDETGLFNHLKSYEIPGLAEKDVVSVDIADLDADLNPEIVISARGSFILSVDTSLNLTTVYIENQSDTLELIDYDGDGDLDFEEKEDYETFSFPTVDDERRLWINNGYGSFSELVVTSGNLDEQIVYPEVGSQIGVSEVYQGDDDENQERSGGGSVSLIFIFILISVLSKNWKLYGKHRI